MDASALDQAVSILDREISKLEQSIDSLEKLLWLSTIIVIVGVGLELYSIIHTHRSDRAAWLRGTIRSPQKPSRRLLMTETASVVLVVGGIVGELAVGVVSANENAQLRGKNKLLVGLVNQKAGQANERASANAKEAEQLRSEAGGLRKSAEDEKLSRLRVEENVLAERRLTARERWLLEHIQKIVFPRQLTKAEHDFFLPRLTGLRPVNIAVIDTQEPMMFGLQFVQLFREAHIMGRLIRLPRDSNESGVSTYAIDSDGDRLFSVLWEKRIGGAKQGILSVGLESIPRSENCLIIGRNDAAFQPMSGQPGENVNERNEIVPMPQEIERIPK